MKQLITIIIFSLLFCACGTSPQNNSMALVLSDTEIIKINPGSVFVGNGICRKE